MHTRKSSQQTFKIQNTNFDVGFERAHQNHNNGVPAGNYIRQMALDATRVKIIQENAAKLRKN